MSRPQYQQQSSTDSVRRAAFRPPPPPPQPPPGPSGSGLSHRATTLRRGKTLTRPERQVAAAPLLTPPAPILPGAAQVVPANANAGQLNWWIVCSFVCTFWAPPALLSACGMKDSATRQAWREKFALCTISVVIGGIIAFLTMGLTKALCPDRDSQRQKLLSPLGKTEGLVGIKGWAFNVSNSVVYDSVSFYDLASNKSGQDVTSLFQRNATDYGLCDAYTSRFSTTAPCNSTATCPLPQLSTSTLDTLKLVNTSKQVGYSWADVSAEPNYLVIDGNVLNFYSYIIGNPTALSDDPVDAIIRTALNQSTGGKDATRLFYSGAFPQKAVPCLVQRYYVGQIDKITPGCFISTLFLYFALGIILSVVLARFFMACIFSWFMSARMVRPPKNLSRSAVSPMVMPSAGAKFSVDAPGGTAPWRGGTVRRPPTKGGRLANNARAAAPLPDVAAPLVTQTQIGAELFSVCLITCYSESLESIKGTCDSLAQTTYADGRKLLFIVADGMITGAGETVSTPDHCVGLLEADERFGNPLPMGYLAVGSGRKRENRAMVYAGHYLVGSGRDAHRVPAVVVVKCGMPFEASDNKPGNRGKRDSQLILMNFFSRVTYNDRMTPLDFDLFRKIQVLTGVTPDFYEVCLMVDADTVVAPDSLTHLVNVMHHDKLNMGVCGETRIANKTQSWVTLIQVYEYFISHHQAKAFESVFGGVTCLPGCFSMYRLKSRKIDDDDWIPIITNPDIIREYAQCEVSTLHQKNLLLLGEDRFLSTLMLRTFPNRKMLFCPQARCRTIAPDTFAVLLSQRRRWINSTVHNLMELVLVRNLCGTFCFSMQFVVLLDLVSTTSLPVAICLTLALIINSIITPPQSFSDAIPLMLLAVVLGLPSVLILITTGKVIYAIWMFPYLLALPVWNFVLPVYSFWHFDDFSWGETRKVLGEVKGAGHDDDKIELVASVPLRRWEDWERSRLRRIRREERRERDLERLNRSFNNGNPRDDDSLSAAPRYHSEYDVSDTASTLSSNEDDHWGPQIGTYNENNVLYPPPPLQFGADVDSDGEVVDGSDLQAMLDQGFDDSPSMTQHALGSYNALGSTSSLATHPAGASASSRSLAGPSVARFALNDGPPAPPPPTRAGGYATTQNPYVPVTNPRHSPPIPLAPRSASLPQRQQAPLPTSTTTAYQKGSGGHAKQRSISSPKNANWGPGGPLMAPPPEHVKASFN